MRSFFFVVLAVTAAFGQPANGQDHYRGKTVTLFAGQPPGGGIDSEMRLVAQFYGKHIPGGPGIVPRNMPGAGGLILGNHLYSVARPDGLTLGMPGRSGFVLAPIISAADTKYDLREFTWIGSSASSNFVLWMRRPSNIRSFDDLKNAMREIVIAGSGSTTSNSIIPEVLAKYENMPIKVVARLSRHRRCGAGRRARRSRRRDVPTRESAP
jgi:tripartite-type tricarboxylate transporter receptor subunit TctC